MTTSRALWTSAWIVALAAAFYAGRRSAPDRVRYANVVVDSPAIVRGEPDAEAGLLERVTRPVARPEQRAAAPGAAAGDVRAFCLAAGYQPATSDRSAPGEPASGIAGGVPPDGSDFSPANQEHPPPAPFPSPPQPRLPQALRPDPEAVAFIRSGRVGLRETELWLVRSSGDLVRESYRVRPPLTFRAAGDSVVVQGSRLWWLRPIAAVGVCAAGGYIGARIESAVPVAVGCGLGATIAVR